MTIEKVKIIDSLGQEFTLPKSFELRAEPCGRKSSLLDVAFAHGAKDVADGCFLPRKIEISGKIWAESDSDYNDKWDALAEHLLKDNIRIQSRNRCINILKVEEISHDYPSQVCFNYGEVSIRFLAIDPFWYAKNATQKQVTISSSPYDFQFDIGGKVETYPMIIFENNALNTNFTLKNVTDGNRSMTIQDPGAAMGTIITVDCTEGTVKRDTTNIISKFSGLFLRLLGGRQNSFNYSGANCVIKVQYKEAWL